MVQFATFPETGSVTTRTFLLPAPRAEHRRTQAAKLLEEAGTVPSPATDATSGAAREAGVVVSIGVNERDGGSLYNVQLPFDAGGTLIQRRRKILHLSRAHDLGPGRLLGPARRRQPGRPHRPTTPVLSEVLRASAPGPMLGGTSTACRLQTVPVPGGDRYQGRTVIRTHARRIPFAGSQLGEIRDLCAVFTQ